MDDQHDPEPTAEASSGDADTILIHVHNRYHRRIRTRRRSLEALGLGAVVLVVAIGLTSNLGNETPNRFSQSSAGIIGEGDGSFTWYGNGASDGLPTAPTRVHARTVASGRIRVSFAAASGNGSAVRSYSADCTSTNGGASKHAVRTESPITVTHLTSGKSYTCTVEATNRHGTGAPSKPSTAVTV